MSIPTVEPVILRANTTWEWDKPTIEDPETGIVYKPVDSWALKYALRLLDASTQQATTDNLAITATADANNTGWTILVTAATTAPLGPGRWSWLSYVEKSGVKREIASGELTLQPDLTAITAANLRSHAQKTLDVIEAALEGRLASDLETYMIAGRSVTKIPVRDLLRLRNQYRAQVRAEKYPERMGREVEVSFLAPS